MEVDNIKTPADLADWLADQVGIWDGELRSPWVAQVQDLIADVNEPSRIKAFADGYSARSQEMPEGTTLLAPGVEYVTSESNLKDFIIAFAAGSVLAAVLTFEICWRLWA
jgi:hypothetical protein